jgi:uncharacterized protein YecA (UPF0149 family)
MHQGDSQPATDSHDGSQENHQTGTTPPTHIHSADCGTHCHSHEAVLRKDLPRPKHVAKIGRNDPCSCGSGKKYKKCCLG